MKISSIILRVQDLDRSIAFWSDVVGLAVNKGPGFASLDGGPVSLLLSPAENPASDESLTEIVFEADDIRAKYGELAGRGVPFEVELRPVMATDARTLVAAHFRDPDGHYGSVTGWVDNE